LYREYCRNKVRRALDVIHPLEFSDKIPNAIGEYNKPTFSLRQTSAEAFSKDGSIMNRDFESFLLLADYCITFFQKTHMIGIFI
jgi:hypothetical protein